jgi:glutamine synthetase
MKWYSMICVFTFFLTAYGYQLEELLGNKSDRPTELETVLEKLKEEAPFFAMLTFTDLLGNLKEIVVPIDRIEHILTHGIHLESSLIFKPDITTLRFLPWTDDTQKTAWFTGTLHKNTGEQTDPRSILYNVIQELNRMGYQCQIGISLDFLLLKQNDAGNPTIQPHDNKKYLDSENNYNRQEENRIFMHALKALAIAVEYLCHEDAPGQYKLSMTATDIMSAADNVTIIRYALKIMAQQLGLHVSFIPKLCQTHKGNSMVIFFSMYDTTSKKDTFYSSAAPYNLSTCAQQFIAGIESTLCHITGLLNSTINSYKRLMNNRNSDNACRDLIKGIVNNEGKEPTLSISIQSLDASANPYIVFAALLKAGIEGIKFNKQSTILNNTLLPVSLPQALDELERSSLAQALLSAQGLREFITYKREECQEYNHAITDWEINRYL